MTTACAMELAPALPPNLLFGVPQRNILGGALGRKGGGFHCKSGSGLLLLQLTFHFPGNPNLREIALLTPRTIQFEFGRAHPLLSFHKPPWIRERMAEDTLLLLMCKKCYE